jgi:hypothetical protein
MLLRHSIALLLVCFLCACSRPPEVYAPPEQRHPFERADPAPAKMLIDMHDADADTYVVKDVGHGSATDYWRWTGQRPTLKVLLVRTQNLKFVCDFALPDVPMRQTGPVKISFFVGDHLLDQVRYTKPGQQHFEKPVPKEWLQVSNETEISAAIDKLYIAPEDQAKLGFILARMGFE